MKLLGKTLLASLALLAGCASRPLPASAPAPDDREGAEGPAETDQAANEAVPGSAAAGDANIEVASDDLDPRVIGDYVTFNFSGGYRKTPLRLTQRVVARNADRITIDYTFVEGNARTTLRATFGAAAKRGELLEIARVAADGSSTAATSADLEAKLAGTAAIADENEALIDERQTTVKVADSEIPATRSVYKVRVGNKPATLETTTSAAFHWGDLGGKIVTADGKIYFSAELVDAGGPSSARASLE
jgi:hypothetical protein